MKRIPAGHWVVVQVRDKPPHVVPLYDLKPHDTDGPCWCNPTDDEGVLVHHSMDRREEFEEGKKPS